MSERCRLIMDTETGIHEPQGLNILEKDIKSEVEKLLEEKERVVLTALSDLSLNGMYDSCALILTDKKLISFDPVHKSDYLVINLNKIKDCKIERMYGNSIFQIVLEDEIIDLNRFSNSYLDFFDEIYNELSDKVEEPVKQEKTKEEETSEKHRCPNCGRTLRNESAVCVLCIDKKKVVKRLLKYVSPHYRLLAIVMVLSLITTIIPLIPPYLTKVMVDDVLPQGDLNKLWLIVFTLFLLYLTNAILSGFRGYNLRALSEKIIFGLRTEVFAKVQTLAIQYYDKRSTGAIMTRVSNDTQRLQAFLIALTRDIVLQLLMLITILIIMLSMHWQLTLLSILPIPLVIIGSKIYAGKMKPLYRRVWRRMSKMNALLSDTIPGIKIIKAFTAEDKVVHQYTAQGEDLIQEQLNAAKMANVFSPIITLLVMTGGLVIWGLGGYWVITSPDRISIGLLIAFISYAGMFYGPVTFFANFNDQLQQAATSAERVFEILDSEPEPDEGKGKIVEDLKGKIEFNNVEFYYEKSTLVLKDVNFTINQGETLGIVGSTGSGKSTIANLLLRYYDCTDGSIKVDDHDIKNIDKDFLRKNIGYVLQEPLLFRDTIKNNISYSKPGASIEEIVTASRVANAHNFISEFPDAYDTMLGEKGTGLSGGEKQRISIARAVIKNPKILVLDEATSAVDTETEKLIQEAIDRLIENRTTLIIAHRLSTLRKADKIMVLEDGEIVEFGTQDELLAREGRFYQLVKMQTDIGSEIIDYKSLSVYKR